jgi:hypothetical protein
MALKAPTVTKENPHEMYFRWYMEELEQYGYIEEFQREPEYLEVFPKAHHRKEKHHKTKDNTSEVFTMLQGTSYTYDFRIIWTPKAKYIFEENFDPSGQFVFGKPTFVSHLKEIKGEMKTVSYVDVKPHISAAQFGGGKNASYYTFPLIQKYLFLAYKLYINKIIPINSGKEGRTTCLFATTFVPNRYMFTDKSNSVRKLHYKKTSLSSYTEQKKSVVDLLLLSKEERRRKKAAGNPQQTLL